MPLSPALWCVDVNRICLFSQAGSVDGLSSMTATGRSVIQFCGFRVINETHVVESESDVMNSKSACDSLLS